MGFQDVITTRVDGDLMHSDVEAYINGRWKQEGRKPENSDLKWIRRILAVKGTALPLWTLAVAGMK